MIILKTTEEIQTFRFIPRVDEITLIIVKDKETGIKSTYQETPFDSWVERCRVDGAEFKNTNHIKNVLNEGFPTDRMIFRKDGDFVVGEVSFKNLIEGRQYEFTAIRNENDIVYRDNIFCTDQDIDSYSINKGIYKERKTDNNYLRA